MSEASEKRELLHRKLDWFYAFIFVVLAHLLLYFMFVPQKRTVVEGVQELKKVVYLPIDAMDVSDKYRGFSYWIERGNPTLFAKPNLKHGFSTVSSMAGFRPPEPDIAYTGGYVTQNAVVSEFDEIKLKKEIPAKEISRLWSYVSSPVPECPFKFERVPPPDYPLWRNSGGKILSHLFISSPELRKKIEEFKPERKTVVKLISYGDEFFPRIKLMVSCGKPELDRIALVSLISKASLLHSDDRKNDEPCYIEIEWRKGNLR